MLRQIRWGRPRRPLLCFCCTARNSAAARITIHLHSSTASHLCQLRTQKPLHVTTSTCCVLRAPSR
jgi:hypothetical protein